MKGKDVMRVRQKVTSSHWEAVLLIVAMAAGMLCAQETMPRLEHENGRFALVVDGKPYLMLGAQVDNSSGWPEKLEALWPLAADMHVNTLEVPVYWEQVEPTEGRFDFSVVDAIVRQAREHKTHLILLWFGTWKNGKMHYVPEWVKENPRRFPREITREGKPIDVLSPNAQSNLEADSTAFAHLMAHLHDVDGADHTVIMMQVENESGSLGSVRDFSAASQKEFEAQVPAEILSALHKQAGTWKQVFGDDADEAFAAYSTASYIDKVAEAGKKELPLPMYVNNWLKSPRGYPILTVPSVDYPSGGPTANMLDIWKAAAPHIDILAPDIYVPNTERYELVMRQFERPDNPLFIPETNGFGAFPGAEGSARNEFIALGQGAIGFSPFGLDRAGSAPDGKLSSEAAGFAENNRLLGSMDAVLAQLEYDGKIQTAVQEPGIAQAELTFGKWSAMVSFPPAYAPPAHSGQPSAELMMGRVLISPIGTDEFLVAGIDARVEFLRTPPSSGEETQLLRVEQGHYGGEEWKFERLWNGDETDHGLNFRSPGTILHVKLGTY
jgi:beta-galactosidase GanA